MKLKSMYVRYGDIQLLRYYKMFQIWILLPTCCTCSILAATSPLERSELNLSFPPTTITTNNQFPERFPSSFEYKSYKLLGMVCEFRL